jgi:hypothetical protein
MIPKEVCHYTKKDIALEKILFERKIKLGLLGLTNDPKESKWNSVTIISTSSILPPDVVVRVNKECERVSKEEWKVLCMSRHFPIRKHRDSMKNEVVSRFRYGYNRPRMWSQYAENNSGVCLVFDGKKLHKNIQASLTEKSKLFHGAVNYKNYGCIVSENLDYYDVLKHGLSDAVRMHYHKNYVHYFLSKYPDWENESEYRWLIHSNSNAPEFVSIEGALKKEYITQVRKR